MEYFDISSILDEKVVYILNEKLKNLKYQYERKTSEMAQKIISLTKKLEKYQNVNQGPKNCEKTIKKLFE